MENAEKDILSSENFKLEYATPKIGETYPLYGYITKIISETDNDLTIEINNNIELKLLSINDPDKINTIKEKVFEPAVFVSKITETNETRLFGECSVVIFGKSNTNTMVQ